MSLIWFIICYPLPVKRGNGQSHKKNPNGKTIIIYITEGFHGFSSHVLPYRASIRSALRVDFSHWVSRPVGLVHIIHGRRCLDLGQLNITENAIVWPFWVACRPFNGGKTHGCMALPLHHRPGHPWTRELRRMLRAKNQRCQQGNLPYLIHHVAQRGQNWANSGPLTWLVECCTFPKKSPPIIKRGNEKSLVCIDDVSMKTSILIGGFTTATEDLHCLDLGGVTHPTPAGLKLDFSQQAIEHTGCLCNYVGYQT